MFFVYDWIIYWIFIDYNLFARNSYNKRYLNFIIEIAGDDGDKLYFITKGICDVTINGFWVSRLKEGEYFGEIALLSKIFINSTWISNY